LALEFALSANRPVCLRYPKDKVASDKLDRSACAQPYELGKSVVVRGGPNADIAIVAYGTVLTEGLIAAEVLAKEGIEVEVVNARFAAPVDDKIIALLGRKKGIITIEDHSSACGFGSAVLELAAAKGDECIVDKEKSSSIRILGSPRSFIKHDSRSAQLMEVGLKADKIAETVKEMLYGSGKRDEKNENLAQTGDIWRLK